MGKKSNLLYIVDDGQDYRFLVEQTFKRFIPQYNVQFFASGDELVAHITHEMAMLEPNSGSLRPDLILLDMHMPGQNGLQTLTELRRHSVWRSVPVVMKSNASSQSERDACYEAGANSFLIKPVGMEQLREMLATICHYWLRMNQLPSA